MKYLKNLTKKASMLYMALSIACINASLNKKFFQFKGNDPLIERVELLASLENLKKDAINLVLDKPETVVGLFGSLRSDILRGIVMSREIFNFLDSKARVEHNPSFDQFFVKGIQFFRKFYLYNNPIVLFNMGYDLLDPFETISVNLLNDIIHDEYFYSKPHIHIINESRELDTDYPSPEVNVTNIFDAYKDLFFGEDQTNLYISTHIFSEKPFHNSYFKNNFLTEYIEQLNKVENKYSNMEEMNKKSNFIKNEIEFIENVSKLLEKINIKEFIRPELKYIVKELSYLSNVATPSFKQFNTLVSQINLLNNFIFDSMDEFRGLLPDNAEEEMRLEIKGNFLEKYNKELKKHLEQLYEISSQHTKELQKQIAELMSKFNMFQ